MKTAVKHINKGQIEEKDMAVIGNAFDAKRAQDSQSYAYKCWYNYNYEKNTMKIKPDEMSEITRQWSAELTNWEANATSDENAYEIEDDDYNRVYNTAYQAAADSTESGGKANVGGGIGSAAASAAGATGLVAGTAIAQGAKAAATAARTAVTKATTKLCEATINKTGVEAAKKGVAEATKNSAQASAKEAKTKDLSWQIGAPMALAVGTLYMLTKPNMKQRDDLVELKGVMNNQQAELVDEQGNVEEASDEAFDAIETFGEEEEGGYKTLEEKQEEYEEAMKL